MSTLDKISAKFGELVKEGKQVLADCGWNGSKFRAFPPDDTYHRFRAEAGNLIRSVCGEQSHHYLEFQGIAGQKYGAPPAHLPAFLGVLEAVYRDYEGGFLFDMRSLIAAELLGDFLAQAEYLLSEGYHVAAASLAGAVLEDTLRKLCDRHHIPLPAKTAINQLNGELAKKQVYNALVQKQITAYADVRNKADHAKSKEFKREDVEEMVKWVRRFAADCLK